MSAGDAERATFGCDMSSLRQHNVLGCKYVKDGRRNSSQLPTIVLFNAGTPHSTHLNHTKVSRPHDILNEIHRISDGTHRGDYDGPFAHSFMDVVDHCESKSVHRTRVSDIASCSAEAAFAFRLKGKERVCGVLL